MHIYTTHLRPGSPAVLVREGFSWPAALFGWLWLACHRAWIPAALNFAVAVLAARLAQALGTAWPVLGLLLLQGALARDLRRWSLAQQGFTPGPIVAADDADRAFARLVTERPDLAGAAA